MKTPGILQAIAGALFGPETHSARRYETQAKLRTLTPEEIQRIDEAMDQILVAVKQTWPQIAELRRERDASRAAEMAWERTMMAAIGEDGPKSVAEAIAALRARAEKAEAEAKRKDQYLEAINDLMWNTWAIKGRRFGRDEGVRIMEILEAWSAEQALAGKGE